MTKTVTIWISLFIVIFAKLANAEEAPKPDSPSATLLSYYEALKKGDLDTAKKLTASFEKFPAEYVDRYTAKYSEGAKTDKLNIKLVPKSSKVLEGCAVVVFEDGNKEKPDYDPAYLIKQEGKWKVLLKLTKWKHLAFEITEDQKKRFTELGEWFDTEKDRLYGR